VPAEFVKCIPQFCITQMTDVVASMAAAMKSVFLLGLRQVLIDISWDVRDTLFYRPEKNTSILYGVH